MPERPTPQPGISKISPYVPGKSAASGSGPAVKLSANESPLGTSPRVKEALAAIADRLAVYPDAASRELREALGAIHGLEPGRIIAGTGSDELLHLLAQTYLGDGDEAVVSEYGFSIYPIVTNAAGADVVLAREHDYTADPDAILGAVTERTRIVWLANPNNPTGTYLGDAAIRRLHAGLRPDILLVIDNAYAEYVTATDFETGAALVHEAENVVMVRTFSKMGLAALRLGWMYGPHHLIDAVNRIRGPWNVSLAAQVAGKAAVEDEAFTARLKAHNAEWRDWLTTALSSNQMRVIPSQGNFVLVLFQSPAHAAEAFAALGAEGIVVREMGGYGIPQALRISIGLAEPMRRVAAVLNRLGQGAA